MSTPTITISSLDSVTIDGKTVGSITNAIANKNATPQQLHDALKAFHGSTMATATQAGSNAATAAMESGHARLASLFGKGSLTADDIKAGAAIVADLRKTARERALAKAEKAAADAQAALAALQAS